MRKSKIVIETQITGDYIQPELHGQFIEHLGNCIDSGIWVGKDSSIPNVDGMRKDVVDALAELEPPIIRWPGGCFADTYHWRDGIGPQENRPVTFNANFGTNRLEYNQFGTHEFMDLCRKVNARPWLNINLLSGTVEEMVSWAEYCNRPHSTTLAHERQKNGDEAPFNVEFWGIGNEAWAGGGMFTAEGYAEAYRRYASAFPPFPLGDAADTLFPACLPTKLIAVGPDGNKLQERVEWTTRFFQAMDQFRMPKIDAYDLHFYNWNSQFEAGSDTEFDEQGWYRLIDGALELEDVILEQHELIRKNLPQPKSEGFGAAPAPKVDLIVGEWGNWHPFRDGKPALWQQNTIRDMITYALTLDIFHRHCDKVKMACLAQSVNVLGSLILTEGEATILTPTYHLFMMYKAHRGGRKVSCEVESDLLYSRIAKVQAMHSFASIKDGILTLNAINTDTNEENELSISIDQDMAWVETTVLAGESPEQFNDPDNQSRVTPQVGPSPALVGDQWVITVKKASVNVIKFKVVEPMSQKQQ
jgi:alpha-N-arabinofuranosidase